MLDDLLLISELADKAGVSVRTIRFYISEGLLPPPQVRGRYSVYDKEYLTRIELIKLLKNAFMPLQVIRQLVESMTEAEIEDMLQKLTQPADTPPDAQAIRSQAWGKAADIAQTDPETQAAMGLPDALEYISKVFHSQGALPPQPAPPAAPAPPGQAVRPLVKARASLGEAGPQADAGAVQPDESESSWRRYTIQPGVELLVSEQVYHQSAPSIHRIVAQVKQLFSTFSSGGKNV